jgi:hypothetical protein
MSETNTTRPTPGPWTVDADLARSNRVVSGPEGEVIAEVLATDDTLPDEPDPERDANAQLVAAAPALRAALQVLVLAPRIRGWLTRHDPKALEQAVKALRQAGAATSIAERHRQQLQGDDSPGYRPEGAVLYDGTPGSATLVTPAAAETTGDDQDGPRFTCACSWQGHLSRSSINCPICFRRLREPVERRPRT